jgi:hypothetical protein
MTDAPSELTELVRADLVWVAHYWEDLAESRLPGTARPWRQPHLTAQQADERDQQARIERIERASVMPGEHPAPVDVGILDTMSDILWNAVTISDEIRLRVTTAGPGLPSTAFADARPYLDYAAKNLTEDVAFWAQPIARRMVGQVARALALVLDGQLLDVECPWCHGKTPETPVGGALTWWVHALPGDQIAIVCTGICEPPAREVGTWWRGQPCWPLADWEGLAARVMSDDEQASRAREMIAS